MRVITFSRAGNILLVEDHCNAYFCFCSVALFTLVCGCFLCFFASEFNPTNHLSVQTLISINRFERLR